MEHAVGTIVQAMGYVGGLLFVGLVIYATASSLRDSIAGLKRGELPLSDLATFAIFTTAIAAVALFAYVLLVVMLVYE